MSDADMLICGEHARRRSSCWPRPRRERRQQRFWRLTPFRLRSRKTCGTCYQQQRRSRLKSRSLLQRESLQAEQRKRRHQCESASSVSVLLFIAYACAARTLNALQSGRMSIDWWTKPAGLSLTWKRHCPRDAAHTQNSEHVGAEQSLLTVAAVVSLQRWGHGIRRSDQLHSMPALKDHWSV